MNKSRLKQVFCKHDYKVWANVYGDLRNSLNASTVLYCTKCGKRKYIKEYIEAPVDYNMFFTYVELKLSKDPAQQQLADNLFYSSIIKDKDLFNKTFGGEYEFEFLR